MLALIERLVNIDNWSYWKEGIMRAGQIVAEELEALGFKVSILAEREGGNHVQAERPARAGECFSSPPIWIPSFRWNRHRMPFRIGRGSGLRAGCG